MIRARRCRKRRERIPVIIDERAGSSNHAFCRLAPGSFQRQPYRAMPPLRVRLFVLSVLLAVAPFFMRRRPRVSRRITICAPPGAVFALINDLRNWPRWTAWSAREEIAFAYGEVTSGVGAVQRWQQGRHAGTLRIIRSEPDSRIDYHLDMNHGKFRLLGRIDLVEDGACTRVTWKCVWEPARNPYMRYADLFFRWMIGRDFSAGLVNLKELVETKRG